MITKDNYKLYESLFADINNVLGYSDEKDLIGDIGDYFMSLSDIVSAITNPDKYPDADPYWLILPSDEELFEINANTRNIQTPTDFSRNGVGVVGDELAEIIYFSIDRYFDITDLFYKDIFIQFELPNGETGLVPVINKTIKYKKDKVVFGWPIDSNITKVAGNVKYSVRFYERTKDSAGKEYLAYSFNTLTSTIKINSGLDFDIDASDTMTNVVIDKSDQYYANLRSSKADNVGVPAAIPTLTDLTPATGLDQEYDIDTTLSGRAYFTKEAVDDANRLMGSITYKFSFVDKNGSTPAVIEPTLEYREIDSAETYNKYDAYWIKDESSEKSFYKPYSDWDTNPETRPTVYKVYATLKPENVGQYRLVATNYAGKGNTASNDIGTTAPWVVAPAKAPAIDVSEYAHKQLEESGSVVLVPVITSPDGGALTYQWYKDGRVIADATSATYSATAEGRYKVKATNNKNNDSTAVESGEMRVSYAPATPVINMYQVNGSQVADKTYITDASYIGIEIKPIGAYSDAITYQWFERTGSSTSEILEGQTDATLSNISTGKDYYVVITNTYNTFTTSTTSEYFTVKSVKALN